MREKYKDREWLEKKLVEEKVSMAELGRKFNRDLTTIRYWRDKFDIEVDKEVKYPVEDYICPVCGKKFSKRVTEEVQAVYCSRECAYKGRSLGYTERRIEGGYDTNPTKVGLECENCGEEFVVDKTEKGRKYCSRECFLEVHSKRMGGRGNPQWKNGGSYEKRGYRGENWDEQRKKCYERDNYECQLCGVKCISRENLDGSNNDKLIQCHHIEDFDIKKMNNELENLITLCVSCHMKVEYGGVNINEMDKN